MKKGIAVLGITSLLLSCSIDDNKKNKENSGDQGTELVIDPNKFEGNFKNKHLVLDPNQEYNLVGPVIIEEGSILTIPAGTIISGKGGTAAYIAIAQGGKIDVQGTVTNPVVMTGKNKKRGDWGGLVICGKAPINKGTTATAEVSDLTYGGTVVNDNSGSIKYLRIEWSGASYNSEKEFNGLTFFGVGNATVVENVQVHEGNDDGFEWFGGTVNTKNLVSTHNSDDQFDWTEGWNGINENWYSKEGGKSNRGIEADNNSNDRSAKPISSPTIKNVTLIGLGESGEKESQALKLREGTRGVIDNVVISNWKTGIDVEHDETVGNVKNGSLKVTNVKFDNVTIKSIGTDTNKNGVDINVVYTENKAATGAGNGTGIPEWAKGWTIGLE